MKGINKQYFNQILQKYRAGNASAEEIAFLDSFYNLFEVNDDFVEDENEALHIELKASLKKAIDEKIALQESRPAMARVKRLWIKYAVVASVLVFLSVGAYLLIKPAAVKNDTAVNTLIVPGSNKARLTLANGQTVVLDDAGNGQIAEQNGIRVHKTADGKLVYQASTTPVAGNAVPMQNTISTPKGGQYQVILPDGTQVMLNAESSIKYPVYFTGTERVVELTGEAYFEVSHNKHMPFKVKSGMQTVEVLGTHFNINAYADEATIKTTLLEGSVKVSSKSSSGLLVPGQQSVVEPQTGSLVKHEVNLEKEIAWKDGNFYFENDKLKDIMRQIARWYNIEVQYDGQVPDKKLFGEIPRNSSLNDVFKILGMTGLQFTTKGNLVIVSHPAKQSIKQ